MIFGAVTEKIGEVCSEYMRSTWRESSKNCFHITKCLSTTGSWIYPLWWRLARHPSQRQSCKFLQLKEMSGIFCDLRAVIYRRSRASRPAEWRHPARPWSIHVADRMRPSVAGNAKWICPPRSSCRPACCQSALSGRSRKAPGPATPGGSGVGRRGGGGRAPPGPAARPALHSSTSPSATASPWGSWELETC